MRSTSCTMETPAEKLHLAKDLPRLRDGHRGQQNMRKTRKQKEGTERDRKSGALDLSQTDLLHLLGIMEGEVQAREDVICMLSSGPHTLQAHYGCSSPCTVLQALHRDSPSTHSSTQDVLEMPRAELERLELKQKETYRRMLEQLLLAEKCHRRTVLELDNEKRKHVDFINKSDDFTNLLEHERERLKHLLEQEKAYQARKEQENKRQLLKVQAELVKLKTFALMLVDERQLHLEQMDQQSQKIQDLVQTLQEKEQRLMSVSTTAREDAQKVLRLEAELELKAAKISQDQEVMSAKMDDHESQSRQLKMKLSSLAQKIEELEERNNALQKSEEDLQELREKISRGECGDSSLMAELENLRKTVLEMEGKDEEITEMESRCKDLKKKLQEEQLHGTELRVEVDKLQKRMAELEKLEEVFNKSQTERAHLHTNLEKEKQAVQEQSRELEMMKVRLKEMESMAERFEKKEMVVKDDLMKLKSFTVILVNEKKNMEERLKQEEQRSKDLVEKFKEEQSKVTEVTEKLIEESKKLFKFKSEMETQMMGLTEEKDGLKSKLAGEEEAHRELRSTMKEMKARMEELEECERKSQQADKERDQKDNRVTELTLEMEELRSRLKQLEVVEGDLMKTEDEYDLLEKKFRMEQDKASVLSRIVDDMKIQMEKNKALEKEEVTNLENELRSRSRMEEVRTRELQAEVQALKEKIHELMNKEDELVQLQAAFSVLQQKFLQEEVKKESLKKEVQDLNRELEVSRRYSRALRPSLSGRRMMDVPVTSTAVQTDSTHLEDETAAGFIRKSVLEEKHLMSNLRLQNQKTMPVLERYPPAASELDRKNSWIPWMKRNVGAMSPTPGSPLHIRVTPDVGKSSATLEISSPRAEDFFSSTTIIPTLGLQMPRITIVPKPSPQTSKTKSCAPVGACRRTESPVTITAVSRARSPQRSSCRSNNRFQSPVSITVCSTPLGEVGVSTDPQEVTAGRTVIRMNPERQRALSAAQGYNGNIVTTEDNKIHIHLGAQANGAQANGAQANGAQANGAQANGAQAYSTVTHNGTVLRSPRPNSTSTVKKTSSLTITPVSSMTSKNTVEVSSSRSYRRVPTSKGVAPGGLGVSTVTQVETRAEGQAMKINLRKLRMT